MPRSPSIAPSAPDDVDVYLVLDDFGTRLGRAWREMGEDRTDRQSVIADMIEGQYSNPVRAVAFNTADGWSRDASQELADEIARSCTLDGFDVPPFLQAFVEQHGSSQPRQLPLPLHRMA